MLLQVVTDSGRQYKTYTGLTGDIEPAGRNQQRQAVLSLTCC